MANSYFQFKKFRIDQDICAMKVSTDACVFGAYIPIENVKSIIDIGTGTGLLALMVAQRAENCQITAIEIEELAAKQATENTSKSIWHDKIEVVHETIQKFTDNIIRLKNNEKIEEFQYKFIDKCQYDLAICNPPFFINSTLPPNKKQQLAHHTTALSFEELWDSVDKLLAANGRFIVLLPLPETQIFSELGKKYQFFATKQLSLQDSEAHKPHRFITTYQKNTNFKTDRVLETENLIIKNDHGKYTDEFITLLQPYYLYL